MQLLSELKPLSIRYRIYDLIFFICSKVHPTGHHLGAAEGQNQWWPYLRIPRQIRQLCPSYVLKFLKGSPILSLLNFKVYVIILKTLYPYWLRGRNKNTLHSPHIKPQQWYKQLIFWYLRVMEQYSVLDTIIN